MAGFFLELEDFEELEELEEFDEAGARPSGALVDGEPDVELPLPAMMQPEERSVAQATMNRVRPTGGFMGRPMRQGRRTSASYSGCTIVTFFSQRRDALENQWAVHGPVSLGRVLREWIFWPRGRLLPI